MKKLLSNNLSFLVFGIFIFSITIFTSCDKKNDADNIVIPDNPDNPDDPLITLTAECGILTISNIGYIQTCVAPDTVIANSKNKYRIENHTVKTIQYGTMFGLEYLNGDRWIKFNLSGPWEFILLGTSAGETTEYTMNLYSLVLQYNYAKPGKYRITKDFGASPLGTSELCAAEFIVK